MGEAKISEGEADELFARILYLLEKRRFGEVRAALEKYTSLITEHAEAWAFAGFANAVLSSYTEAGKALAKAEQYAGDDANTWFNIGVAYSRANQKGKAKSAFKKAEKIDKSLNARIKDAEKTVAPDLIIVVPERLQDIFKLQFESDDTPTLSKAKAVPRRAEVRKEPEKIPELSRKEREREVDSALALIARNRLISSKKDEKDLLKTLDEIDKALRIYPHYRRGLKVANSLRLTIFLALGRYEDAVELYKQMGRPKAGRIRFLSMPHLFNFLRLYTEYGKETDIIRIYGHAQRTLMEEVRKNADTNLSNHHLWNIVLLDSILERRAEEVKDVSQRIRDIGFEDRDKLRLLLKLISEVRGLGWMLYNDKTDMLEFYWNDSKMNINPEEYAGWTILGTKLKSSESSIDSTLAEECFKLAKQVGESAASEYIDASEEQEVQPFDELADAGTFAMFEESGRIGQAIADSIRMAGGIQEMYDAVEEWEKAKKDKSRRRKTGKIGKTTVRCPKCMSVWMLFKNDPIFGDQVKNRELVCTRCGTKITW
ncbi:MAG: tetratricopeptide repeat protein [Candidatus Thorarchaeota archaeon]